MVILPRLLDIKLPEGQSAFLWGPRKTGKSTYLRQHFPGSLYFDLLDTDLFIELTTRPALLRERLLASAPSLLQLPIIIDEVQKIPQLLDEVHWLIEQRGLRFVLCGSSARKLVRGRGNLLGGRAWRFEMLPFTTAELGEYDLLSLLNRGLLPDHLLREGHRRTLRAYAHDYLKEEIFAEGLTRNIPAFSRFFEAAAFSHGELVSYASIARECGVDAKTVKEYFQILVDTLLGRLLPPYKRRQDRNAIARAPKLYLFDVGVAGALVGRQLLEPRGEAFGRALEHLVLMEIVAFLSYRELDHPLSYWRTKSGQEVDFVLGEGELAVEVKGAAQLHGRELRSIHTFADRYRPRQSIVVCTERAERVVDGVRVMPYRLFFEQLWEGRLIS